MAVGVWGWQGPGSAGAGPGWGGGEGRGSLSFPRGPFQHPPGSSALPPGWDQSSEQGWSLGSGNQEGLPEFKAFGGQVSTRKSTIGASLPSVSDRPSLRTTGEIQVRLKIELPSCQGDGTVPAILRIPRPLPGVRDASQQQGWAGIPREGQMSSLIPRGQPATLIPTSLPAPEQEAIAK